MSETFPIPFGRYQLVERLAMGGMAELFKARVVGAHGFQKPVVIKRILPHLAQDASFVAMFIDEAKITARLDHPKIAQVLELGTIEEQLYIAMEFVDGPDVLALLRACAHRKQTLPTPIAVHIAAEVLDALQYAHHAKDESGAPLSIVHRDISPSNVLISRRGDVKLADFGIAHAVERQQKTQTGTLKGKYGYMSPEQVVGGDLDGRSDLFSVGIVLAEMLMGRRLFTAPNELDVLLMVRDVKLERLDKYGGNIHIELRGLIEKSLQKSVKDRYQTAAEFRDALQDWLFSQRLRVGPRELAELVEDLLAGQAKTPLPGPLPMPSSSTQIPGAPLAQVTSAAAGNPVVSGTLAGPNTKAQKIQAEELARAGRAAAAQLVASGGVPAPTPPASTPPPTPPPAAARPPATPPPSRPPPPPRSVTGAGHRFDPKEIDAAVSLLASEDASGPIVHIDGNELSGKVIASPPLASSSSLPPTASPPPRREPGGNAALPGHDVDFADLNLELDISQSAPPPKRKPTAAQIVESVKRTPAPQAPRLQSAGVAERPDAEGDFSTTPPIRVLYKLAVDKADGLLVTEISAITKEIYLAGGTPEYVSSNVARELLGEYLVAQRVISQGELAMALAMMPHFGGKLGDTLVGLGLMKPLDVFRHLTRQVRDKIIDVCTWHKGTFRWYRGKRSNREAFPLGLDAFEVLGAGATAIPATSIEHWLAQVGHRIPSPAKNARVVPEAFRLGNYPREIYERLDGRTTLRDLAARQHDPDQRAAFLRTMYLLVYTDLVAL